MFVRGLLVYFDVFKHLISNAIFPLGLKFEYIFCNFLTKTDDFKIIITIFPWRDFNSVLLLMLLTTHYLTMLLLLLRIQHKYSIFLYPIDNNKLKFIKKQEIFSFAIKYKIVLNSPHYESIKIIGFVFVYLSGQIKNVLNTTYFIRERKSWKYF